MNGRPPRHGSLDGRAASTVAGQAANSFLLEVDRTGLAYQEVVSDFASQGIDLRLTGGTGANHWDLVASVRSERDLPAAESAIASYFGAGLVRCTDRVFAVHRFGKLNVVPSVRVDTAEDLALVYTPGVARACRRIAADPAAADELTGRANTVAIVTDGSAVLGLGNLGPAAALPVMEGKAVLFDRLAGINAVPLCLATTNVDQVVAAITAVAPSFGGINLEDIAAPGCFEVEARLQDALSVPVFHDDQHGTAVVVLAALWNALTVVGKTLERARIVVSGAGAAGTAVTKFLLSAGATDVVVWVPSGVLHPKEAGSLPAHKRWLAENTNPRGVRGELIDAVAGADVFIGVSGPGVLTRRMVEGMAPAPIVFALANPDPEIDPAEIDGLAAVVATGRSDYPNQINNVLAFPGIFRGVLDARARQVSEEMKLAAAHALAELGRSSLTATRLLPDVLDPRVVPAVATAVRGAAAPPATVACHDAALLDAP